MSPQPFPHLLPAEQVLWWRWLQLHRTAYDRFEYDVRVGKGRPVPTGLPAEIARDWTVLTQKRIDAVGWQRGVPTLFEVNPRGSRSAFGAVILYRELFVATFDWRDQVRLALVVGRIDPDTQGVAEAQGIAVYVLPEEGST